MEAPFYLTILSAGAGAIASTVVSNIDIDTGTENVDSFPDINGKGAFWSYIVSSGANLRSGIIMASWDAGTNAVVYTESSTGDVGDTSGVSFSVDINADNVRLRCTVGSDNWAVYAIRTLLG